MKGGHRVLEASAGTGKTTAIIDQALSLLLDEGVPVDQLLIVTFTEKAASELRRRLREGLDEAKLSSPARRARCQAALQALDRATVSTIHQFCFAILREYAFEAGELFDQPVVEADGSFADLFDRYRRGDLPARVLASEEPMARGRALYENRFFETTVAGACAFYHPEICRLVPDPDRPFDPTPWCRELANDLAGVAQVKRPSGSQAKLQAACRWLQTLVAAGGDPASTIKNLRRAPAWNDLFNRDGLTINGWVGKALPDTPTPAALLRQKLERLAYQTRAADQGFLARMIADLAQYRRLWLRSQGKIDFREMLARASHALRRSPALVAALRRRFRAALVDEFQDTDPLQWEIFATLFARSDDHRLILVGDEKQAIYAFRGADVATFRRAIDDVRRLSGVEPEALSCNYRTAPRLVAAIDHLFAASDLLPGYARVTASPQNQRALVVEDQPDPHPLQIVVCREPTGAAARAEYARFVAREIGELLRAGAVFHDRTGARPLRASDIAVLVRGAADENAVQEALAAAGLPCAVGRPPALLQTREAREWGWLLDAIAAPHDQNAVKKALLTRFFAFPVEALERFAGLSPRSPLFRRLHAWGELARRGRWPAMGRAILEETGVLLRAAGEPDGETRVATLLDLARELALLADQEGLDLCGLSRRLRYLQEAPPPDGGGHLPLLVSSDRPKVQVMTVHAAKGLEFPVVFVGGWFTSFHAADQAKFSRYHPDPDVDWVPLAAGQGAGRDEVPPSWLVDLTWSERARQREAVEQQAEESRLFYVAMTRAIGRVYLPWMQATPERRVGPLAGWLRERLQRAVPSLATAVAAGLPVANPAAGDPPHCRIRAAADAEAPAAAAGPGAAAARTPAASSWPPLTPPPEELPPWPLFRLARASFTLLAYRLGRGSGAAPADPGLQALAAVDDDDREALGPGIEHLPGPEEVDGGDTVGEEAVGSGAGSFVMVTGRPDGVRPDLGAEPGTDRVAGWATAAAGAAKPAGTAPGEAGAAGPAGTAAPANDDLPGGARTGTLVHQTLETIDFAEVLAAATPEDLVQPTAPARDVLERMLRRFPPRRQPDPGDLGRLARLIWQTLRTPLPFLDGEPLAAMADRRHEVGFLLPAPGATSGEFLGMKVADGLLTGSIDVVVRHQGRYFLLDFKTTWSSSGSYAEEALATIMAEHHYHLQALIYAIALRRMLRSPLFGAAAGGLAGPAGAGYLFVRGLTGRPGSPGIFFHAFEEAELDTFERETLPRLLGASAPSGGMP
ncbi:MAG: Exodeoxyribonuclease V beta chain [Candidatus Ozemobacter sibiricus]|uniref:DNA 3'-5' helicase n=1 Tax=Candidatus Ozemobacter sibiricus TaxID=2268124 RepID=A0A367Z8P8_9BACT|nr:MAG: Exodeoxyribonuclease V beta chain [Candidatus Ozemobacter sibiricus]